MKSDTAVSDLIAVMALIAVFVTAAAIAGVALLSYPPGDAAPAMIARSVTDESGSTYIYHDGGDPLERGHFAILVDGVDRTENFSLVDASTEDPSPNTDWTSWKTGQALILVPNADVTISEDPHIQIVGEGMSRTGSDWLLHDIGNITPTPTAPTPTAPTPVSPVANFIATPTSGEAPLAVNFTDLSTNAPTAWTWDFGDNATSDQRNPIHTYTAAGTYTVTLTATNAAGSDDEVKTGYITVSSGGGSGGGEAPVANFTANITEGNAPLAVQFTDTSTGVPTSWAWDFGDGNTATEQNPIHTYESPGNYSVTLNASNAYGYNVSAPTTITVLEPLVANFTYTPNEGNAPLAVTFNDTSTGNVTAWSWDFGDGNTSTEKNPIHTYVSAGNYTISLNASNAYGFNVSTVTDAVRVLEPPTAAFTATPTEGNAPLAVTFNDTSTGNVTAWLWNFGDGNTSTEQNPIHTYAAEGTYTVTLNASNAYGYNVSAPVTITVLEPPAAAFTANVTEGNAPLTVQFTDESTGNVTAWLWDFGDGNTSTDQNPVHTYESPGTYTVSLNASNAYGSSTETRVDYITVLEPPTAAFTATPTEGNAPLTVQFTDESTGNVTAWLWDFGDGNTSTEQNPVHTYESPGNYTVSLNASNAYGYNVSAPVTITVLESPAAAFSATPTEGNAPLAVQFTDQSTGNVTAWAWDFGDGNTSAEQNPGHTYESPGTYTVTLTANNAYGTSTETRTNYITVLEPPAAAFTATPTEGNAPLAVQFTDESTGNVTSWSWDFGDGTTSPEQNPGHTYAAAGTYTVTLNASNAYGFSTETRTDYITVLEPPAAAFTANVTEGNTPLAVQFTDQSTGNVTAWAWDFGDGNTSTGQSPNHTYTAPGTYIVSLTASNAYGFSTETKTDYITVLEPPAAAFTANVTEGNAPLAVQFTDESTGNVTAWAWDFGDGNTSTEQNPVHTYESTGNYSVTLNASNAYGTSTLTKPDYIRVTGKSFANFVIDENVFVYGNALQFSGNNVYGPGATVIVTGDLDTADTNLGASIAVTDIYIDGDVALNHGSAGLGSSEEPGSIQINGDLELWNGARNIYGDVYVAGNFSLKDARIHGNVYVDGNLTLGWTPWIADDAHIYYTGNISKPDNYNAGILAKCIHQETVPEVDMPDQEIPSTKSADWYAARGYDPSGDLTSNMKIFADSYSSISWKPTATNVTIIASTGDITITGMGGSGVTGVFFAPNGKVTFNGGSLEGVVIARDGFFVTSGGTDVTFKNLNQYISNSTDYPF